MDEVGSTIPAAGPGRHEIALARKLAGHGGTMCRASLWTTRHIAGDEGLPQNSVQAMAMDGVDASGWPPMAD